jgi:hypothetical protein
MRPNRKHLALLTLFLLAGCKSTLTPLGHGYRAVTLISKARNATAAGIEVVCKPRLAECVAKHPKKEQKNWNWIKSALPALCGLLAAVKELKPILGDKADKILGYLELGRKYVCP